MIQVIERVCLILDYLAQNQGTEIPLTEIADNLDMNRATAANILKTLKELELVNQSGYRGGYVLGDKIYSLAGLGTGMNKLKSKAKPLLDRLAREVNENVIMTVIRGKKRDVVYKVMTSHNIEAKIIDEMSIWSATTAKVIIAHYDKNKLNNLIKLIGMPGNEWPEIHSRQDLDEELRKIAETDCTAVIFDHFACITSPVFQGNEVVASIGIYLPDIRLHGNRLQILKDKVIETAQKVSAVLQ